MSELWIILVLVIVNGVFAGAEIAVLSLRKTRLLELLDSGSRSARAVAALRDSPERFLATVQVGITVIGATAAAFGGANVASALVPLFSRWGWLAPYAQQVAFAVVVVGISYLSLVLGELVPKSLALRSAERYALLIGRPLLALSFIARPLVWFLTTSSNLVLRPFGDRTTFTEARLSTGELQQLVEEAAKVGSLDSRTGEIASRAISFGELIAEELMVPRRSIVAAQKGMSEQELLALLASSGFTRLPVYGESVDDILGYITVKDVLQVKQSGQTVRIDDILRPAFFVPRTARAVWLLEELQRRRVHLAFLVDEHGGVLGIATMEDLVEELVGEIFSEHDRPTELIVHEGPGRAVVQGRLPIRELNRALDIELPEEDGFTTVAGLTMALAGCIPAKGAKLSTRDGVAFEVLDASPRAVRRVRVTLPQAPDRGDAPGS